MPKGSPGIGGGGGLSRAYKKGGKKTPPKGKRATLRSTGARKGTGRRTKK